MAFSRSVFPNRFPFRKRTRPRAHVRMAVDRAFRCELGEGVDVSRRGMQVRSGRKPKVPVGHIAELRLRSGNRVLSVRGRIAWIRKRRGEYRIGVAFVRPSESLQSVLESLGKLGFIPSAEQVARDTQGGAGRTSRPRGWRRFAGVNHYEVLKVSPQATNAEVRAAYRRLARTYHPDLNPEPTAESIFTKINMAYQVLKDPQQRARYDRLRACV